MIGTRGGETLQSGPVFSCSLQGNNYHQATKPNNNGRSSSFNRPHQLLIAFKSIPFWPGNMEMQILGVGVESQAVPFPPSSLTTRTWLFIKGAVEKGHYGPCATMGRVWTTHTFTVMAAAVLGMAAVKYSREGTFTYE